MARVSTAAAGSITLGVAVGPLQYIADQLLGKALPESETEFALPPGGFGVSRINHILRVHGHTILQEQRAAEIYDEVGAAVL